MNRLIRALILTYGMSFFFSRCAQNTYFSKHRICPKYSDTCLSLTYHIYQKYSNTLNPYHTCSKILTTCLFDVFKKHLKRQLYCLLICLIKELTALVGRLSLSVCSVQTLIRRRVLRRLILACSVCQCPSPGFADYPLYKALWRHSDENSAAINNRYLDVVQTRALI